MGKMRTFSVWLLCGLIVQACLAVDLEEIEDVKTYARYVPDRQGDFAWENDIVAFRAYGPGSRKGPENSGIDCWLKRVPYSIINRWYSLQYVGKSYNEDYGEGLDNYHVGSSAGCGGAALWLRGKRVPLGTFIKYEVKESNRVRCEFTLIYSKEINGVVYGEERTIKIERGKRLLDVESVFTKNGIVAKGLSVCVGLTTHDGLALTSQSLKGGWISCWEQLDDSELWTGVRFMDPYISTIHEVRSSVPDQSHILILSRTDDKGSIRYQTGFAWKKEGSIRSKAQWEAFLNNRDS